MTINRTRLLMLSMALIAFAGLTACGGADAAPANKDPGDADAALRRAMNDQNVWASHGRDYTNERFSPLSQITASNVDSLQLAWKYHTNIPHAFETTPLVIDS